MAHHTLACTPETVHWGWFAADLAPVLTVASGDTVTIETLSGAERAMPPEGFHVPEVQREIQRTVPRMEPGHLLTGPVAVEGARPGDVLEIRIKEIELGVDWGWNMIHPLIGTLTEDFPDYRMVNIPLDKARNVGVMPWGLELELAPFFGVMGVAPPPAWGKVSSVAPRAFGGNLDLKELVAGTTLYLPVFVEGGRFSCGDGHGVQGDGEVNVTAIETALTGTFEFILRPDLSLDGPLAETPEHHVTIGLDPDLDRAAEKALKAMIALMGRLAGLGREDAYMLCSLAADLRITQTVNGSKGVHCMVRKALLA